MILYTYDFSWEKKEREENTQIHAQPHTETDKKKCMTEKLAPKRIRQFDQQQPLQQQIEASNKTITRPTLKDFLLLTWLLPEDDKGQVGRVGWQKEEDKKKVWIEEWGVNEKILNLFLSLKIWPLCIITVEIFIHLLEICKCAYYCYCCCCFCLSSAHVIPTQSYIHFTYRILFFSF